MDKTGYVGQLWETENAILRSQIRIARLQSRISGAKEIRFDQNSQGDRELAAAILNRKSPFSPPASTS